MRRRARPTGAEPRGPPSAAGRVRRGMRRRCDVGLRRPFSDTTPTRYERGRTNVHVGRNRMRAQRACLDAREDAWWRNARARGHRQNHPHLPLRPPSSLSPHPVCRSLSAALATPVYPRRPFGTSLASLYPARSLCPFSTHSSGLTYREEGGKRVVRGQEDTQRRVRGAGGVGEWKPPRPTQP